MNKIEYETYCCGLLANLEANGTRQVIVQWLIQEDYTHESLKILSFTTIINLIVNTQNKILSVLLVGC